jgi:hypothetical protein
MATRCSTALFCRGAGLGPRAQGELWASESAVVATADGRGHPRHRDRAAVDLGIAPNEICATNPANQPTHGRHIVKFLEFLGQRRTECRDAGEAEAVINPGRGERAGADHLPSSSRLRLRASARHRSPYASGLLLPIAEGGTDVLLLVTGADTAATAVSGSDLPSATVTGSDRAPVTVGS